MKRILLFLLIISYSSLEAQTFKIKNDTISKSKSNPVYQPYNIRGNGIEIDSLKNYNVFIKTLNSSTLNENEYDIDYNAITLQQLNGKKEHSFFLKLKKDSIQDRVRNIHLRLGLKDSAGVEVKTISDTLRIVIKPVQKELNDYAYLAYVGTNFDLVDGVEANNLFFAANIFLTPERNKWGWYLSLYGNRTLTAVDSTKGIAIEKYERLDNNTVIQYRDEAQIISNTVSDNLGAHTSFLLPKKNINNTTNLFIGLNSEFVWRRTQRDISIKNRVPYDTVSISASENRVYLTPEDQDKIFTHEFAFSIGPGIIVAHQNKNISVRLHASVGGISEYYPSRYNKSNYLETDYTSRWDVYFSGRAWITEATSGITLQAEVTNNLINNRPLYVVTLSKAINFKNLGDIFSPVTSRQP